MAEARSAEKWHQLASSPIARALAISLMLHFVMIAGLELGRQMGWWRHTLLPASTAEIVDQMLRNPAQPVEQEPPETQLVFVEVDPSAASAEPPPETTYYSSQNSRAANPDPAELEQPKVDGRQTVVPRAMDTMRPQTAPPEPAPQEQQEQPKAETQPPRERSRPEPAREAPQPETEKGDLVIAKATPRPQPPREQTPPPRPRTLAQARAQKGIIEGPKMQQDGGVRRHRLESGLDVKATPFGAYDAAFIAAVQARWYTLLDERDFVGNQSGKVVLEFRLTWDGRIADMRIADSEVNEMLGWLCQRAVLDPAPYARFPADMRRMLRNDYRDVRFTFYYNQ